MPVDRRRETPTPRPPKSPGKGLLGQLRSHPIVCLALLTPGIPEYLSSSSPLLALVVNPAWFFVGLAINVGQYTAGALLVREALIRWGKGWPSGALLALAYGVTEEGLGDNTLFRSTHGGDGVLGHFGRYLGVNWLWSCGVLTYHVIFSIGLPILLLGLALPATRGRSLLGRRGIVVGLASVGATTFAEQLLVLKAFDFWMGVPLLVGSLATIAALTIAARSLPASRAEPRRVASPATPFTYGAVGFFLFPALFAVEYGPARWPEAALPALVVELIVIALFVLGTRPLLGARARDHELACLSLGLLSFLAVFGVAITLPLPYTVPLTVLVVIFARRLERHYRPAAPAGQGPGRVGPQPLG